MTAAENEYARGHATALNLLAELQEAIEDMPNPEMIAGDWGYAGSMSYINGQLRELLTSIRGDHA